MKYIIFICVILFLFNNCSSREIKGEMEIYYFKYIFTAPIPVDCNSIFDYFGLRKIEINSDETILSLQKIIDSLKVSNEQDYFDVRYKVIHFKDTLCLDSYGGLIYNGIRMKDSPKTLNYEKK